MFSQLSGREMFTFNPELAMDDAYEEGDEAFDSYCKNEDEDDDTQVLIILEMVKYVYHVYVSCYLFQYFDLDITALGFTVSDELEPNRKYHFII